MVFLASNSPRRRQLLNAAGIDFTFTPAAVDEQPLPGEDPPAYVQRLAEAKARAARPSSPGWVLAADTTVALDGEILGKPDNLAHAAAMLGRLRGRDHVVYTALTLLQAPGGPAFGELCASQVPMRAYSDGEIEAYVASGDPLDKAGAYAIQHPGFAPVERLQDCYANVVGLPLCHLARLLRRLEQPVPGDLPRRCQAELGYDCPVYDRILRGVL
jgi:MAF protein